MEIIDIFPKRRKFFKCRKHKKKHDVGQNEFFHFLLYLNKNFLSLNLGVQPSYSKIKILIFLIHRPVIITCGHL